MIQEAMITVKDYDDQPPVSFQNFCLHRTKKCGMVTNN